MNPTDGPPDGWEVVKEAPTAAEVIAHLDAHGKFRSADRCHPWVQYGDRSGWARCVLRRSAFAELHWGTVCGGFRLIAPISRPQVDPAAPSVAAKEPQGATGAGVSDSPGPVEHADPLPACPLCGAQPGGCEHVTVHQRGESAKPGGVVLRRTVVTITYPWEDA